MGGKGCQGVGTGKGRGKGSEIVAKQGRRRKLLGRRPNVVVVGGGTGRGSGTYSVFLEVFFLFLWISEPEMLLRHPSAFSLS